MKEFVDTHVSTRNSFHLSSIELQTISGIVTINVNKSWIECLIRYQNIIARMMI